jgi:hypothetical protein
MGNFGGAVMVLDGQVTDLVSGYGGDYARATHARAIRRLAKRWGAFLTNEREWCVVPKKAVEPGSLPFDAHFDDNLWFFFSTAAGGESRREAPAGRVPVTIRTPVAAKAAILSTASLLRIDRSLFGSFSRQVSPMRNPPPPAEPDLGRVEPRDLLRERQGRSAMRERKPTSSQPLPPFLPRVENGEDLEARLAACRACCPVF